MSTLHDIEQDCKIGLQTTPQVLTAWQDGIVLLGIWHFQSQICFRNTPTPINILTDPSILSDDIAVNSFLASIRSVT